MSYKLGLLTVNKNKKKELKASGKMAKTFIFNFDPEGQQAHGNMWVKGLKSCGYSIFYFVYESYVSD